MASTEQRSRLPVPSPRVSRIPTRATPTRATATPIKPRILRTTCGDEGTARDEGSPVARKVIRPAASSVDLGTPGRTIRPAAAPVTPSRLRAAASTTPVRSPAARVLDGTTTKPSSLGSTINPPSSVHSGAPSRLRPTASTSSLRTPISSKPSSSSSLRSPLLKTVLPTAQTPRNKLPIDTDSSRVEGQDKARLSIREQIAARRKALLDGGSEGLATPGMGKNVVTPASDSGTSGTQNPLDGAFSRLGISGQPRSATQGEGDIFGRRIPVLVRKGMITGRLDVANMMLERLPRELWTRILGLEGDDLPAFYAAEPVRGAAIGGSVGGDEEWDGESEVPPHEIERRRREADEEMMRVPFYEVEDLSVIKASGNAISVVEDQIGLVGALKSLDLHSNQLRGLPDSLINLRELAVLDVSDNQFTAFPPSVILSPSLTYLNISRNNLTAISWNHPVHPNPDLLQSRAENSFFDSFPSTPTKSPFRDSDSEELMPSLKTLNLSDNRITGAGLPDRLPRGVEVVDLSRNAMVGVVDLSVFTRLPRLKRLLLPGNGITGVVVRDGEGLWPCLECLDMEGCELTGEEELVRALKLPRGWTPGDVTDGVVQIKLEGNPIVRPVVKKPHPATIADRSKDTRSTSSDRPDPSQDSEPMIQPAQTVLNLEATGPLVGCWNAQQQSIIISLDTPPTYLDDGVLDLALVVAAVPGSAQLRGIEVSGVLQLRGLSIPDRRLASVTNFSIVNTSLCIEDDTLERLAEAMPRLEMLDLSGSRIEHVRGVQSLCANGLERLLVKGCRITDISALEDVASQLHEGRWRGSLQLEEVDIRDNAVEKLEAVLGCLPLRTFMVESNAFRVPHRRVWEREGTAGLLRWLREGL